MKYTKELYREYLKSEDWKKKRNKKLCKKRRCWICWEVKNLDVHHLFYKNWYDVENSDLRVLCRRCHYKTHDLMKDWVINFKEWVSHHSRFATIKYYVAKELWFHGTNMFYKKEETNMKLF